MSEITIYIKFAGGKKYEVKVKPENTVSEFKELVSKVSEIPAANQRLIYSGKVLKDNETVESYKIQDQHTVHLVKNMKANTNSASTASSTGATAGSSASQVPSNLAAGTLASDPLANLTGARYAGYGINLPSADMFGSDGVPTQETMDEMLNNPMFSEMMRSMLSNPQALEQMIDSNPMLRSMGPQAREMIRSPMFREMLSNPEMLRSAMNMQRQMGGSPFGGASPFGSSPFGAGFGAGANSASNPATNTESNSNSNANSGSNTGAASNTQSAANSNPFAAMFPGGFPQVPPFGGSSGDAGANPMLNPANFASLFGGMNNAGAAPQQDTRDPAEKYEAQLRSLNDMGFTDFDRNVAALRRSGGSIQGAIDSLLNGSV